MTSSEGSSAGQDPEVARSETSRLLALLERHHTEAARERERHHAERLRLEAVAQRSDQALEVVRQEASADRQALREELSRFRLEVDAKLKEMALQKLRSERIVEHVPVGIAYLDRELVCQWANPAFSHLVRLPFGEVVGRGFSEAFPDVTERVSGLLREVLATGEPNRPVRLPFVHSFQGRQGVTHWDMLALPLTGDHDQVDGIVVALEVTERVERERVHLAQIERLTELERLRGGFVAMLSHELRTPLAAIAGYAEFLQDGVGGLLSPTQHDHVAAIQVAEARIRSIVDHLLDFARMEAGTFRVVAARTELLALVRRELTLVMPQGAQAGITPTLITTGQAVWVLADPDRLGQVLLNLVENAIRHTPAGGSVAIAVDTLDGQARVSVTDTGSGLLPEHQSRVFDRFYQVEGSAPGSPGRVGLGLAVARALVERQGGRIGVESRPGEGATFWFTVPLCPEGRELVGR